MAVEGQARAAGVQSVDRAVSILESLAELGLAGVTEISAAAGIHKSTVFRLLSTLESRGLVEQDDERGRYRIGHTAVQLAAGASQGHDIARVGHTVCQELAQTVGESVHLAIHDGVEVITVDQVLGRASVSAIESVGKRAPLHATAAGKVFLAEMSAAKLDSVLSRPLEVFTESTISDREELKKHLAVVREFGYARTDAEHEVGLVAIAMPVRTLGGRIVGAVTISGPIFRVNDSTVPGFLGPLAEAATKISWRCGYLKRG